MSWNGFSGFRIAAVIVSEWPSPLVIREPELPVAEEESVDTTFPVTAE